MLVENRLLRLRETQHLIGLSRSTIYRLVAAEDFPSRVGLSQRTIAAGGAKLKTISQHLGARLSASAVGNIFKSVAKHIKLAPEEIGQISGHSIRVGATQDLLALNIVLASVMQAGRWKSHRMPMQYGEHVLAGLGGMARAAQVQGR
jgi:hypothetical protein